MQIYVAALLIICHQFILPRLLKIELNVFFQQANKNVLELNPECDNNRIKQYHMVKCIVCCIDVKLSRKSMTIKDQYKVTVLI